MTKDQRAQLVALIYEYGNAVGRSGPGEPSSEAREKVEQIQALLDELTEEV